MHQEAITLTFGDCAENHVGMQQLGTKAEHGVCKEDLFVIKSILEGQGLKCEIVELHAVDNVLGERLDEAYVLIARNYLSSDSANDLFEEMKSLKWDTKALMRGRVVNKHARLNICFDFFDQEPDYASGKGRVVDINSLVHLNATYRKISTLPECADLKVEGNFYNDLAKCGIGFHGDTERRKVVGVRLGVSFPLYYRWYKGPDAISAPIEIRLNHGDLYIMSDKAVGYDWRRRSVPTLRHAAGASKYTGI